MRYGALGTLTLTDASGADRTPRGGQLRLLLATLLARQGQLLTTSQLAEQLWAQRLPANPANALQNQVTRLRRLLVADGTMPLVTERDGYRLVLDPVEFDALRFEGLVEASAQSADRPEVAFDLLDRALELWRGPAYGELGDRPLIDQEAARLEELRVHAAQARGEALLALGRPGEAASALEWLAAAHPLRERPHALLMQALYVSGRQSDALDVFHRHRDHLDRELGLEPGPELVALQARILRHELPAASLRPAPAAAPLPPVSSFVGRAADLAAVLRRLTDCRLVTICGTGGVGKTRLALEVAARAATRYRDAVCLVELSTLAPGSEVAPLVASALRVANRAGASTVDRLVEALAGRRMLLLLDNCEHVLDHAAELIDALLRRTRGIDVLATSRTALATDGEHVWPLVPLAVEGREAPAVRLLAERAAAARPGFTVDGGNAAVVDRLCRRLDGLPLALELAAGRLRVAPLEQVAAAVETSAELLAGARRTGQARHRSLEALVDWSYRLLDPAEQQLFARLSVFRAPFELADAVAVAAGDGLAAEQVPAALWSLVEQSLVAAPSVDSGARYALLETLRHAAAQHLAVEGATERYRRCHADRMIATAREAAVALHGPGAAAAVAVLDRALPELRAAREHLDAAKDRDGLLELCSSLFWYGFSGIQSEVLSWIRLVAHSVGDRPSPLLPAVLGAAAMAEWQRGDLTEGGRLARSGIDAAARLGDPAGSSLPYSALADVALFSGDPRGSRRLAGQARARAERNGQPIDQVYARVGEAMAAAYGDDPQGAVPAADEAIGVAEASGSPIATAWACYAGGEVRLDTDPDRALALLERAVAVSATTGERMVAGAAQLSALSLRCRLDQPGDQDLTAYHGLIEHWRQLGAWTPLWTTVRNLVELLVQRGDDRTAARLLGAAEASSTASPTYGAQARRLDAATASMRSRLGRELTAEIATGRRLGDLDAIALALEATRPVRA